MNDTNNHHNNDVDTVEEADAAPQADAAQKELAGQVMGIYQRIDETLNELRIPDRDRKEVEQKLMEAVGADLLVRLSEKMTDEQREELMGTVEAAQGGGGKPDLPAVAAFFNANFDQKELLEILAVSTESVLNDFIKEMGPDDE
ncbi:MAG: hypothetical protein ACJKTH_03670 [Patescibacteria group bacterium UBA2163]